jgi:hypothetical protein
MAKLSRDEVKEIVRRDVPGTRVVETDPAADPRKLRAAPDLDSPDLDALRAKYLGNAGAPPAEDAAGAGEDAAEAPGAPEAPEARAGTSEAPAEAAAEPGASVDGDDGDDDDDDDVEIVSVAPEQPAEPWDRGARPKAVVVSSKEKRVIGRQG